MNIVVPVKLVPDLVEELNIGSTGLALDTEWIRLIINEFDDHAVEQAILLKERGGGQVTVIAPAVEGVDDVLFTAAAKGADRLMKLEGAEEIGSTNHSLSRALAAIIREIGPDLVLTGVQAHNDLDGSVGPLLAEHLGFPYIGYVAGVDRKEDKVVVRKEYPAGLVGEMEVTLPAVLGIQAAEKPPRYIAVSKIRQAMQSASIASQQAAAADPSGAPTVTRMFKPEMAERAAMLEGSPDEVAVRLVDILKQAGVV